MLILLIKKISLFKLRSSFIYITILYYIELEGLGIYYSYPYKLIGADRNIKKS